MPVQLTTYILYFYNFNSRFAADCMKEAQHIFRRLEVKLGPETSDLAFRAGLHSGPVTVSKSNSVLVAVI